MAENGSSMVTCTCQSIDLVLFWEPAIGMFDLWYYVVNISGLGIMSVNFTSFAVPVSPNKDYLVLVSTVSKCKQSSNAVTPQKSTEGIVRAGK